ncbi:hypothetical protein IU500_09040 [Nocardia terpenica]|uniref:DUF6917 domain-containing protein n=1 Tax=Nocardia terpenica TaxID=455432 RepID=A0A161X7Q9_9NOCA|nr:hypothetical protein [Nocardia terpenica]KZM69048.1 hypothetical protein AWN90_15010 [Nocardia terpenica]MBF6062096.1 hypothetical protein [Nocardia terpenica]MBF6104184.1 hypothetical protein [Nocardia terpenica]MBF6109960.1 hypothetical protein [Nocardia terpenica]MBF6120266.1 hypothetical protein [Nocardia terpenica]
MNPHEDGAKFAVAGSIVKVLRHRRDDRGMSVSEFASRCVGRGEVHELVTTDHTDNATGAPIDRVGFLGFAEITAPGVIDRGDEVHIDGIRIGTVLGFDSCHYPNHYNILIHTPHPLTGTTIGLRPGSSITFAQQDSTWTLR